MYHKTKSICIGYLSIIGISLGVLFLPFARTIFESFEGTSVYAAEEVYQESFIPLNINLGEKDQKIIQLDYLCKIDNFYMIIGKITDLQIDTGYYLKGTTNKDENISFHLSYADENIAFFTSGEKISDFSSVELQLFEQKSEGKRILSMEKINGDIFEDV